MFTFCKARWTRRRKNGKKKWPKYQKPKDENMGQNKEKILPSISFLLVIYLLARVVRKYNHITWSWRIKIKNIPIWCDLAWMRLLCFQVDNFTSKLISCFIWEQKRRRKASSFKSHKWDSSVNWGIVPAFQNLVKSFLKVHW